MRVNNVRVTVHLYSQSQPIVMDNVHNTYQKGTLFCVLFEDGRTVHKFPIEHIFRIIEEEKKGRDGRK